MKRSAFFQMFAILVCLSTSFSVTNQKSEPSDPYKAVLNRLQSPSIQAETPWHFHTDVPHPADRNAILSRICFSCHSACEGTLPPEHSFVQISPGNVIVTALKKAEDDSELVLRFYEWAGKEGGVKIHFPSGVESASETNLMERATSKLQVENGTVMLHTKPYEIKTVKVQFGSKSGNKAGQVANANDATH